MKHVCEFCNSTYDTIGEAEKCEFAHKREKMMLATKATAEAKISDAINAFVKKYNEMPNITLTEDNQKVLVGEVVGKLEETFDLILNILGDECDEEECGGCEHCDDCNGCPHEETAE